MNTTELVELLKSMVAIPSLSRDEGAVADFLEKWMKDRGLEPKRALNNIWLESEPSGDKPTILLDAHLDTVKPASGYTRNPFEPRTEDGRIYGLGTNDDGASLVSLLGAYLDLTSRPQPYRLVFSASAEEEVTGVGGLETALGQMGPVSFGIIGEPTGMRMALAEKGLLVLDCVSKGISGHAARTEGVNALYKALDDIAALRSYEFPRVSEYLGKVRMTVTMISAGTQHNVVPDTCSFVVDVRPNGEYSNEEIVAMIRGAIEAEVTPRSLRNNSSSISKDHPAVRRGLAMGLEPFGSPTTSNSTRCGFPTVKIGPGDSARSHTADEFIYIKEIEDAIPTYVALLDSLQI